MNCRDLHVLLDNAGGIPLPEAAQRHLAECAVCRRMVALFESGRAGTPSGMPQQGVVPEHLLDDLEPVRPLPHTPRLVLFALVSAALVCALLIEWWGLAGWGSQTLAERLLLFGAVDVALFASAYGLAMEMIPGSKAAFDWRWAGASAAAVFLVTVLTGFHQKYRLDMRAIHGECFGRGLLTAAAVLLLLFVGIRGGVFLHRVRASLTIATLLSSAALLVLTSYCPILSWSHVLIAHVGSAALVVIAAAITGKVAE
jgi:hypothetical protein